MSSMQIQYKYDKTIPIAQLDALFRSIGWQRDKDRWLGVVAAATYIVTAWNEDQLVGLAHLWTNGVMAMIYDVGVHPDYQRHGIGRAMMTYLIDSVKDKGLASIGLFAWEANPQNIPFYKKLGFERTCGMELTRYMVLE